MITRNYLNIYKVNHRKLKDGELAVAKDIYEAIHKFSNFYDADIDIFPDDITGVTLHCQYEVIDEDSKYE